MKSLTIGIFTDGALARDLAKKGTESDITLYNRKTGDTIYTFLVPRAYPDKFSSLLEVAQVIDVAIVSVEGITKELGETLLVLDALALKHTFMIIKNPVDEEKLNSILSQTSLGIKKISPDEIIPMLDSISPPPAAGSTRIIIDHSFHVKSVGTVALGFLRAGSLKPYDSLQAVQPGKEVMIKSIQMQGKAVESATAPSRVGLSLKGAELSDLERGTVLARDPASSPQKEFRIEYAKCPFSKSLLKEGARLHLSVGMQFREVTIKSIELGLMTVESVKPFAISAGEKAVLADNSSKGLRLAASGTIRI